MSTDNDDMRRLGYGAQREEEMILVNRHAFDAIIRGAMSHAVHSDSPPVARRPAQAIADSNNASLLDAFPPKADEDILVEDPADPELMAACEQMMEVLDRLEDRIEGTEADRAAGNTSDD